MWSKYFSLRSLCWFGFGFWVLVLVQFGSVQFGLKKIFTTFILSALVVSPFEMWNFRNRISVHIHQTVCLCMHTHSWITSILSWYSHLEFFPFALFRNGFTSLFIFNSINKNFRQSQWSNEIGKQFSQSKYQLPPIVFVFVGKIQFKC